MRGALPRPPSCAPSIRRYVRERPAIDREYPAEMAEHWQKVNMPRLMDEIRATVKAAHSELDGNRPQP